MANVTAADVRNVAFRKPALGRRGYDEQQVDDFLDAVEATIVALTEQVASLQAQLGHGAPPAAAHGTVGSADGRVLAELQQIRLQLARIEASSADPGQRRMDPLFGGNG
ncbi:MAG TPA: DivIVA domain-containing protein [Micromonosporaceae bacterium]|nr:DivIVA domain-containing protein [Micromonosporaceae bacterium]